MRRNAGAFLREKILTQSSYMLVGGGFLLGLGIGSLAYYSGVWIGSPWSSVPFVAVALVALAAVRYLQRDSNRWSIANLEKGLAAEIRVEQIIELALAAESCAVAHSVTSIAKVGDIDHLVATPLSLWVIETKYKRVPRQEFSKVLSRIAANTIAVRRWAPKGTPVRGCLVLAYESSIGRREYENSGERITVYTPHLLFSEMQDEVRQQRLLDKGTASAIWNLSRVPNLKPD